MKDEVIIRQAYAKHLEKRDERLRELEAAELEANPDPRAIYDLRNVLTRLGAQIHLLSWVLDDEIPPMVITSDK